MSEPIHIALAFDEAYARHAAATIASVLTNATPQDAVEFHVLDNGLSTSSQQKLQTFVETKSGKLHFIKLSLERFASFPIAHHAAAAYSRLALPELLPNLCHVIYLDSDVIVLKSLRPLWETRLDARAVAVVQDAADVFGSHFLDHKQRLGLRLDQPAFNSGVMLMNLTVWREKSLATTIATWIEKNSHLMLHSDQDALNAVMKDQICFLDPIWNVQAPLISAVRYGVIHNPEWIAAVRDPAIIHYTTEKKPWNYSCAVPCRKDYRRFAELAAGRNARLRLPTRREAFGRICAEAVEFRHWLAALVKGRLRRV